METEDLGQDYTIVPILKVELSIVDRLRTMDPKVKGGHMGLYHDKKT